MTSSNPSTSSLRRADRVLQPFLHLVALVVAAILVLVIGFLLRESWPLLSQGRWLQLFTDTSWHPLEGRFGLLPMLWATLAATLGAISVALPLGLAAALFEWGFAPKWLAGPFRLLLGLLAGIPSVVFGLWGLTVLVPLVALWQPPGASLFTAILILALMILPTVALISGSALRAVPTSLLQGAAALGMRRVGMIIGVVIPAARRGLAAAALLASARALGETMAVLMVAGNVVQSPTGLFEPVRVLTANIALEMAYATGEHRAGLFVSGLLLAALAVALAWWAHRTQGHD